MKVAYILTMHRTGMAAWNFREIDILTQTGVEIYAYPLIWTQGHYMPKPDWHFRRPYRLRTVLNQLPALMASPGKYLRLLRLAIKMHTVLEFFMAADFSLDMRRKGVEHIHCHFGDRKLFTGYYCSKLLGLNLTVTVHAYEILSNPKPAMFRLAAAECRAIVVQSEFNRREIMREFGLPEDMFRVIRAHGDMSDERARTSVKALIVGEFREKKGHEVLFRALKKLDRNDITLWVVGDGLLDVRKMAQEIGVAHLVTFLGRQDKSVLNILYDACDLFVLPSRTTPDGDREGIPAVIMEAMSHHKPVISTRHAGIPELLPDVLVDENDVDGLADALSYVMDSADVREKMGQRNYEIVKRDFSDSAVLRLKHLFEESASKTA